MYDVVGDVHGYYDALHRLMLQMGYVYNGGQHRFFHPEGRKTIFVGDYIDRGTENVKTVRLVRNMTQFGNAHAIMGNHDFNAVMMTIPHPDYPDEFLRRHSASNLRQQKTYLDEVRGNPKLHQEMTDWFKSLPVYLQIDKINVVHASWYPTGIDYLTRAGHLDERGCLTDSGWYAAGDKHSDSHEYFDVLLKGLKEDIPKNAEFIDSNGHNRRSARIAWWNANPKTNGDAYASMPQSSFLKKPFHNANRGGHAATIANDLVKMPNDEHIFFGHISILGEPKPLNHNVTCVDYGIGKGGCLTAFRIADMDAPNVGEFVSVPTIAPVPQYPTRTRK